ncbi:MAG: radical SAM protein [Elusimicrobia bacterium]|nr:radical SAM protein [Candidatus Liberimonas magnetica]
MKTIINIYDLKNKLVRIPKYPRLDPPYRVHWNWDISFKCNYKCSYCEVIKRDIEFKSKSIDISRWEEAWEKIFEKYWGSHVRFSGGEPTIYPNFWGLVKTLLKYNSVDITTNLSFDMKEFLDKIPPNNGVSISSSFHPEFDDMKKYLDKVKFLHHNGFPSTICYVGYPNHLGKISEYKKMVESERIYFKVIPFAGKFNDKWYPQSYSVEEKMLLEGIAKDALDEHLKDMNSRWYDWRVKREEEPGKKVKTGELCRMGQMYAKIHPDGSVTRCCAGYHGVDSGSLGSILDKDFKLLDEPAACKVSYQCPCFKSMLVGQEEDKWVPLWEALEHPVYRTEYMKEYANYIKREKK